MQIYLKRLLTRNVVLELLASGFTMAAVLLGTTTLTGGIVYFISLVFWWWIVLERKMWGMVAAEIGFTAIAIYNFWTFL